MMHDSRKITPRTNRKDKNKVETTPRGGKLSATKRKGTAAGSSKKKSSVTSPKMSLAERDRERDHTRGHVGTDGPGGRERKKQVKVGDKERKRARDEKIGFNGGDGFDGVSSAPRPASPGLTSDRDENKKITVDPLFRLRELLWRRRVGSRITPRLNFATVCQRHNQRLPGYFGRPE